MAEVLDNTGAPVTIQPDPAPVASVVPAPPGTVPTPPPVQSTTSKHLAYLVVGGFFFVLGALLFVHIPDQNVQMVNLMVGSVIGASVTVLGYHFGSSATGDTMQLRRQTPAPPPPGRP